MKIVVKYRNRQQILIIQVGDSIDEVQLPPLSLPSTATQGRRS